MIFRRVIWWITCQLQWLNENFWTLVIWSCAWEVSTSLLKLCDTHWILWMPLINGCAKRQLIISCHPFEPCVFAKQGMPKSPVVDEFCPIQTANIWRYIPHLLGRTQPTDKSSLSISFIMKHPKSPKHLWLSYLNLIFCGDKKAAVTLMALAWSKWTFFEMGGVHGSARTSRLSPWIRCFDSWEAIDMEKHPL